MTIQLELSPEFIERLAAEAQAHGIALEEYAESLLREAINRPVGQRGRLSPQELRVMLEAIAAGSERLPQLPTSAFSRETFYADSL